MIDNLKAYGIQFKKLGLATFWGGGSLLSEEGALLSGFTSGHKKLTLISGGYSYRNYRYLHDFLVLFRHNRLQAMSFVRKVQVLSPTSDISNCASRTCLCNLHLQLYIYIYIFFFFLVPIKNSLGISLTHNTFAFFGWRGPFPQRSNG